MKHSTLLLAAVALAACSSNAPAGTRAQSASDATVAAPLPAVAVAAAPDAGPPPAPTPATVEKMRSLTDTAAKALIDAEWTPGLVVALVDESGETYLHYGVASTGGPAVDEDTIFEIGSVTDVFTSTLLAQMVGQGKAKLEEPVVDLLPPGTKVPERNGKKITLEQLATHRSGLLRAPADLDAVPDPYASYDSKKLFAYFSHASLQNDPGTAFEYSNTGAGLLGLALSQRAKQPYGKLVVEGVARPLGMKNTGVDVPRPAQAHLAQGYADGEPTSAWHFDALAGAGALHSNARDLARFVRVQLGFVPEAEVPAPLRAAIKLTQEPRADSMGGGAKVGLGWLISADGTRWWHNGGTGGFRSYVAFDPVRKRGIVVLANAGDDRINNVAINLAQVWNGLPQPPMKLPVTAALDSFKPDDYVGTYPITAKYIMQVVKSGKHIRLLAPGQKPMTLWPTAPDKFYMRALDAAAEFERDDKGKVVAIVLLQSGQRQRAPRGAPGEAMPPPPVAVPGNPHDGIANPGANK